MYLNSAGNDFEEAAHVFGAAYNLSSTSFTPTEEKFQWRLAAVGDERMTLRKNRILAHMQTTIDPGDEIVVAWTESGRETFQRGQSTLEMARNTPYVMHNGSSSLDATAHNLVQTLIHIDKRFLREVAEEIDEGSFIEFELLSPALRSALPTWRSTMRLVAAVMLAPPQPTASLLNHEMARLVAGSMLATFPYLYSESSSGPSGVEPARVKTAQEFIRENAHLPIGPVDIAAAAGISVRSLEHALRRYRETTPMALLRLVRLDRVHDELSSADPANSSVSAIAHRWGFVHLGRFSAAYRARFGELPSRTLRAD